MCLIKALFFPVNITVKKLILSIFLIITSFIQISIIAALVVSKDDFNYLLPALASIVIFLIFSLILKWQVGENLLGELGYIYLIFALAYTLFPAYTFITRDTGQIFSEKLATLVPDTAELGIHLWRHVAFIFGCAVGYLLMRGRRTLQFYKTKTTEENDNPTIAFLIGFALICIIYLGFMSAPVGSYIDNYTRYAHLSMFFRKTVSFFIRFKLGIYCLLIIFLFRNFNKYKLIIYITVVSLCAYEFVFSSGSRIHTLVILMEAFFLYGFFVKKIKLKKIVIACITISTFYYGVEIYRNMGLNLDDTKGMIFEKGLKPPSELGSVYFTGFHLYSERSHGNLPSVEWPMFFYDFISPFVFADFTRWNPQYWYARNYFPYAEVPPETMGPIAESAIWGGVSDLLIRSIINGAFFAWIVNWFIRRKKKWWGLAIYVYCYSTCVLMLKYSVFLVITPLVKTLLPIMIMVHVVRRMFPSYMKSA